MGLYCFLLASNKLVKMQANQLWLTRTLLAITEETLAKNIRMSIHSPTIFSSGVRRLAIYLSKSLGVDAIHWIAGLPSHDVP